MESNGIYGSFYFTKYFIQEAVKCFAIGSDDLFLDEVIFSLSNYLLGSISQVSKSLHQLGERHTSSYNLSRYLIRRLILLSNNELRFLETGQNISGAKRYPEQNNPEQLKRWFAIIPQHRLFVCIPNSLNEDSIPYD